MECRGTGRFGKTLGGGLGQRDICPASSAACFSRSQETASDSHPTVRETPPCADCTQFSVAAHGAH